MIDLFETPELIPAAVQAQLDAYYDRTDSRDTYAALSILRFRLQQLGYTIDWGLDAEPYGLCAEAWLPELTRLQQLYTDLEPDATGCGFITPDGDSGYIAWDEMTADSTAAEIEQAAAWYSCCGDELGADRMCPTCQEHC